MTGTLLSAAAVLYSLTMRHPLVDPQDFVLAMLSVFSLGGTLGAWAYRAKVDGLESDKSYLRAEVSRLAERRVEWEKNLLKTRLTSEKKRS